MTTPVFTAKPTTDMIQDIVIAHTFTPESTEAPDGTQRMEQLRSVLNVIEDLQTTLWSGETSSDDTWEIVITMRRKD